MLSGLRRTLLLAVVAACAGTVSLSACQSPEVEPETQDEIIRIIPIAGRSEEPFVMLVVDKSGSMLDSTEAGGAGCNDPSNVYQPGAPCKWTSLLAAFTDPTTGFLSKVKNKNLAQVGLTLFPGTGAEGLFETGCEMGDVVVPLDPAADGIDASVAKLKAVTPAGGTPIAVTLRHVAKDPMLEEQGGVSKQRFVMLLTDGEPNCNPANAQRCLACDGDLEICQRKPDGCRPTWGEADRCDQDAGFLGADCLDDLHTVEAVRELREQGVETIVIGFGPQTADGTVAAEILDAAAEAGGRARSNSGTKYYQAGTQADLEAILEDVGHLLIPCTLRISPVPTSAGAVQVAILDSQEGTETELVQNEQWRFTGGALDEIEFLDEQCSLIKQAEPERYSLRLRYVVSR